MFWSIEIFIENKVMVEGSILPPISVVVEIVFNIKAYKSLSYVIRLEKIC